ncbi:hypothetical protein DIURU_005199 [Diutina rugosa]|uniref:Uncharacterized protein n=1 Tax=Diutina rugosa TaxID=5481 RepID=A0A642UEC0_DIURU|nr:uncharacterized protein DIURU_005199 [Diutina rugosa]KAA8897483.1 hypothetical protein DIURU_005199 [Diutina rugosa]
MGDDESDAARGSGSRLPQCYRDVGDYIEKLQAQATKYRQRAKQASTTIASLEQTVEVQASIISSLQDQVMAQKQEIDRFEDELAKLRSSQTGVSEVEEVPAKRARVWDNIPNLRHQSQGQGVFSRKQVSPIRSKSVNIPRTEVDTQYSSPDSSPLKSSPSKCQRDIPTQISSSPDKQRSSPSKSSPSKSRPSLTNSSSTLQMPTMAKQASVELGGNDDDEVDDSQDEEPLVKLVVVPSKPHPTPLLAQKFRRQYLVAQLDVPGTKLDLTTNPVTDKAWTVSDFVPNGDLGAGGGRKSFASVNGAVVVRDQGISRQDYDNRRLFYSMVENRDGDDGDDDEQSYSQLQSQIHNKVPSQEWRSTIPSTQEALENAQRSYMIKRRRVVRRIKQSLKVTYDHVHQRVQSGDFRFAEDVLNQFVVEGRVVVRYSEILQGND